MSTKEKQLQKLSKVKHWLIKLSQTKLFFFFIFNLCYYAICLQIPFGIICLFQTQFKHFLNSWDNWKFVNHDCVDCVHYNYSQNYTVFDKLKLIRELLHLMLNQNQTPKLFKQLYGFTSTYFQRFMQDIKYNKN